MPLTQEILLGIKKSFKNAHWAINIYSISPDTAKSSTTVITLSENLSISCQNLSKNDLNLLGSRILELHL